MDGLLRALSEGEAVEEEREAALGELDRLAPGLDHALERLSRAFGAIELARRLRKLGPAGDGTTGRGRSPSAVAECLGWAMEVPRPEEAEEAIQPLVEALENLTLAVQDATAMEGPQLDGLGRQLAEYAREVEARARQAADQLEPDGPPPPIVATLGG